MTTANILSQLGSPGVSTGFKNRIINGAMTIDQRNAGASVTANDAVYAVDRFRYTMSQSSKGTSQQSTTAPVGFSNSVLFTSSSAYSVLTNDYFGLFQTIEGYNVADLSWGTANAKTVTLSFQVQCSLTGTFTGSLFNSAANRWYVFSYSIPVANTWTSISITIPGDTSGTWLTTNGLGLAVLWSLGAGSGQQGTPGSWGSTIYRAGTGQTSVVGTNGATFYITGVQLEVGTTATNFEVRSYGQELLLCERYCQAYRADATTNYTYFSIGQVMSSTESRQVFIFKTPFRGLPSVTTSAANTFIWDPTGGGITVTALSLDRVTTDGGTLTTNVASSSLSAGQCVRMIQNSTNTSYIIFSAEL